MDDGGRNSISGRGMVIDISSFSRQDECILQNMMLSKFLCDVSFHRRNGTTNNTKLYINAASAPCFCNLIRPFIIPSMLYKLTC